MLNLLARTLENSFVLPLTGLVSTVSFSTSAKVQQNPNHRLYPQIDWDKVSGGNYAVVDPADTAAILYLSERDYKIQLRVSLSSDSPLVVLARAGEVPIKEESKENPLPTSTPNDPTTKKSPPKGDSSMPSSWDEHLQTKNRSKIKRFMGKLIFWAKSGFSPYVKPGREGDETLVTVDEGNFTTLFSKWALLSLHWVGKGPASPAAKADISSMANYLLKILKHQGASSMIKHMKLTSVAIRRFLAGNPVKDSWELEIPMKVCANGLPSWLPVRIRRAIASESIFTLRWIFTLLNQYKGFKCSYKSMDLSNIIAPHPDIDEKILEEFTVWCETYWKRLVEKVILGSHKRDLMNKDFLNGNLPGEEPFMPVTAGPNCSVSLLGAALDAYAWVIQPVNWLKEYLSQVKDDRTQQVFDATADSVSAVYPDIGRASVIDDRRQTRPGSVPTSKLRELSLGKLAIKLEAAGKKRIFAIPDYWTQRALKPLHTWMMDVLSVFPSDATFDQNGSTALFARAEKDAAHSYDLKAATDTIPQDLYRIVFKTMLPAHLVDVWMMLLTDRWFKTPLKECPNTPVVQYSRGQPMGALSSWPSMAMVHHAIVQFSAHKAGVLNSHSEEFWAYRVLGDDVVIGNGEVGRAYTEVCEALHVKIGRKVSLVSDITVNSVKANNKVVSLAMVKETCSILRDRVTYRRAAKKAARGHFFEFANQFWLGIHNVSPLSFKQELGINTVAQRIEFAIRSSQKWPAEAGTSWVARLVRYLLPPAEYVNSTGAWRRGQLGATCQGALIAAFGPTVGCVQRLGFQWSSIRPLLLAYANSSTVIGGDQRLLQATLRLRERELLDAIFLRYLTLFRARILKMRADAEAFEGKFHTHLHGLRDAPSELVRVDAKDGSRPNWVVRTASTHLEHVLEDHLDYPVREVIHDPELTSLPLRCYPKGVGEAMEKIFDFLNWSEDFLVIRDPPQASGSPEGLQDDLLMRWRDFVALQANPDLSTKFFGDGGQGGINEVNSDSQSVPETELIPESEQPEAVQTDLVPYVEGGALTLWSAQPSRAADPLSPLGINLRDLTREGNVIAVPPSPDDPLYEVWVKGEAHMPALYPEWVFSELCEKFAKLLPPVEVSVALLDKRENVSQRSKYLRDLEAMERAVGAILPIIQQVGYGTALASGAEGTDSAELLAGDRYTDVFTKKPLR